MRVRPARAVATLPCDPGDGLQEAEEPRWWVGQRPNRDVPARPVAAEPRDGRAPHRRKREWSLWRPGAGMAMIGLRRRGGDAPVARRTS